MATLDMLQPRRRHLKRSGMHDALAARLAAARARQLDPLDFLLLLVEDELARREGAGIARRRRQAQVAEACALWDFAWNYNPELPKAQLWNLASGR